MPPAVGSRPNGGRPEMLRRLARLRVPLGFACSAIAILLAHPTRRSLAIGFAVAVVGEAIRVWASGHLEKGREVTRSGPYRWSRHPLYVGSSVIAAGVAIAGATRPMLLLVLVYMAATLTAAVRTEEAFLRGKFGDVYDAYAERRAEPMRRRFSFARARLNREYRAVAGVAIGFALLALKFWLTL